MILVIGFWTFLRALLFGSAAVALENLALRHQLLVLQQSVVRPRLLDGIASSGSGCHGSGRVGGPISSSCSPRPFWRGTAKTFSGSCQAICF